jgi:release factor glutamine methyltransferase
VGPGRAVTAELSPEALAGRLAAAGCLAPDEEAAELWAGAPDQATLAAWLSRREQGEPLAWIVGTTTFCGRRLRVDRGVYVPRSQSEDLARRAVGLLAPGGRAVDLCTGTGAVAAHLLHEVPGARLLGVDLDRRALACARANGVPTLRGDLGSALCSGAFDLVTAVAPYVPTGALAYLPADVLRYEPIEALDGGDDGLAVVRRVVADAQRLLVPGGWLLIELGGEQDELLAPTLGQRGFGAAVVWADEEGDRRGLAAPRLA